MVAFEDEADVPEKRRIRYADDEEAQEARGVGPMLSRQLSSASQLSTRSNRSITRRRSIDPALAIPIEYRTLYAIAHIPSMFPLPGPTDCPKLFPYRRNEGERVGGSTRGEEQGRRWCVTLLQSLLSFD